jgi:hypothetical protein
LGSYFDPPKEGALSGGVDFIQSAFSSGTKEMIGFDPSPDVAEFRQRNPIAGLVSEVVGMLPAFWIPLAGQGAMWWKGVQALPGGARAFKAASTVQNTFLKGVAMESLRWAPWQSARLVGSVAGAPFGARPSEVLKSAAFEMPLFAGIGGGISFLGARKFMPTPELARQAEIPMAQAELDVARTVRGYNMAAAPQEKVAAIDRLIAAEENVAQQKKLREVQNWYEHIVRREEPGKTYVMGWGEDKFIRSGYGQYVTRPISKAGATDTLSKRLAGRLNSLFANVGGVQAVKLAIGKGGFETQAQLDAAQAAVGELVGPKWMGFAKYMRQLFFDEKGGKKLKKIFDEDMPRMYSGLDRDVWFVREQGGNGAWVGIARIRTGDTKAGANSWFLFKTHEPQRFAPGVDSLEKTVAGVYSDKLPRAYPGIPKTEEDARLLAARMGERNAKASDGQVWNPDNPEHISELLSRTLPPESLAPLLHKGRKIVDSIDPGEMGLRFTPEKGRVRPSGRADERYVWNRYFDSFLSEDAQVAREEMTRMLKNYGFMAKKLIAPASVEFRRHPRGPGIWFAAHDIFDESRAMGHEILFGKAIVRPGESMIRRIWDVTRGIDRTPGLLDQVRPANVDSLEGARQFWSIWLSGMDYETIGRAHGIRQDVLDAFATLDRVDARQLLELDLTRQALGLTDDFVPMKRHFLISRSYRGDFRVPLYQAAGDGTPITGMMIGAGSGYTPKGAVWEAKALVDHVNKSAVERGLAFRLAEIPEGTQAQVVHKLWSGKGGQVGAKAKALEDQSTLIQDLYLTMSQLKLGNPLVDEVLKARTALFQQDPSRFLHRTGKIGFAGYKEPLPWPEIKEAIISNVMETRSLIARDVSWNLLREQMITLAKEDINVHNQILQRWNQIQGVQGPVNRMVERAVDSWAAPALGRGAATKMVRTFNESVYMLTLGAFDAGFVTINALTPIQTVLPELAYTLKTPPQRLAEVYAHTFVKMPDGEIKVASFVDPIRYMKRAWQLMGNPDEEFTPFLRLAVDHGVMGRQYIEQVVGGDSRMMRELFKGKVFSPDVSAFRNVLNAMQTPVAMSEEFSRGYAFTVGYLVGKDFHRLSGQRLWNFAKRFAERTNYAYDTASRPRTITGAIGSGWGLFKNWTWNYITNMAEYSDQALRGNWEALAWAMIGSGAVGGAIGVPGYGIASAFAELFSDKDLTEWTYEMLGNGPGNRGKPWVADTLMYGFPSLLGVSLQGRASVPGAMILRDMEMLANTAHMQRAQAIGNIFSSGFQMGRRGMSPYDSEDFVRNLMVAFAPRTMQRWYASTARDGLMSLHTGNRVMPSPNWFQTVGYSLGWTPLMVEKSLDAHNELYEDTARLRARVQFYGNLLADAADSGSAIPFSEIINRAMYEGVDLGSLARSYKTRRMKNQGDLIDRMWDPYISNRTRMYRDLP